MFCRLFVVAFVMRMGCFVCADVLVAQWIRHPPTKREIAGSSPVEDFFLLPFHTPRLSLFTFFTLFTLSLQPCSPTLYTAHTICSCARSSRFASSQSITTSTFFPLLSTWWPRPHLHYRIKHSPLACSLRVEIHVLMLEASCTSRFMVAEARKSRTKKDPPSGTTVAHAVIISYPPPLQYKHNSTRTTPPSKTLPTETAQTEFQVLASPRGSPCHTVAHARAYRDVISLIKRRTSGRVLIRQGR